MARRVELTMEEAPEGTEEEANEGGLNVEALRSYAAFAGRAIKKSKLLIAFTIAIGFALTVALAKYLPRTYTCQTVIMTVANSVLDSDRGPQPFAGAEGLIMSHENLEGLIAATNLKQKYYARRPPLMKVKDRLIVALFGPMNDKVLTQVLVGTLESKLTVKVEKETLTIGVDWSDGTTAAELTQGAKDRFLEVRHRAEISAFQEKMAILDAHAAGLREEIDALAEQIKANLKAKAEERKAEARKVAATGGAVRGTTTDRLITVRSRAVTDEQLPELKERLTTLRQKLSTAENDRNARIREQQAKLDELQLRLTPNHPQVITQQERVGIVSQVSSELSQMRSEVADLESQIRQREAMVRTGKSTTERVAAGDAPAGARERGDSPPPPRVPSPSPPADPRAMRSAGGRTRLRSPRR